MLWSLILSLLCIWISAYSIFLTLHLHLKLTFSLPFYSFKTLIELLSYFVGQTNAQISRITEELSEKSEELVRYQEEISSLLSQIVDLQHKLKEVRKCWWSMHACMHAHTSRCVCLQWVKIDLQGGDYITVTVSGKYGRGSTLSRKSAKKIIDTFLCFQHVIEKEELKLHLQASKDAQRQLTAEVLKVHVYVCVCNRIREK